MTSNTELIEPDYWMKNHGRALRTAAQKIGLKRAENRAHGLAKKLAVMAWNYPGQDHRGLIAIYLARYGK